MSDRGFGLFGHKVSKVIKKSSFLCASNVENGKTGGKALSSSTLLPTQAVPSGRLLLVAYYWTRCFRLLYYYYLTLILASRVIQERASITTRPTTLLLDQGIFEPQPGLPP